MIKSMRSNVFLPQLSKNTLRHCYGTESNPKKSQGGNSSRKRRQMQAMDKRYELLVNLMYTHQPNESRPIFYNKGREQNEIIERMWCLEKEKEAYLLKESLQKKYVAMRLAIEALEKSSPRIFAEAIRKDDQDTPFRFPLKYRVPTETLPVENWEEHSKIANK